VSVLAGSGHATLARVLRPAGVAVLGASAREGALSRRFLSGLVRHGYAGRILPVNPRYEEIDGLRCHPTVAAAAQDGPVDLAVVALPRDKVLGALEECHAAGVSGAVVFASGFGETGAEGHAEQERLARLSADTGLRVVGPNSPGFVNVSESTCVIASGVSFRERFAPGGIALVAQSGGVAGLLLERAQDAAAGISLAVCTGNEADVTAGELLAFLAEHEPTRAVGLFVESIRRSQQFAAGLAALRAEGKPVVAIKAGATAAAARATAAHTGALATADDVVDAFLARHGVVRVHGFDQLIDTAVALERLGPASGRRVGIVTTSGGAGVLATEAAERAGLELPPLGEATRARLEAVVPDFASLHNPADMSGMFSEDPEIFRASLAAFADAHEFDTTVLVVTVHPPEFSELLADRLIDQARTPSGAPVVLWTAGAMSAPARGRLRNAGIAVFEDAERCMRALAARTVAAAPAPEGALDVPAEAPALPPGPLLEQEALALVAAAGVRAVPSTMCVGPGDAAAAAREAAGPVVVKAAARDLEHKSDAGAVIVGVEGPGAASAAHRDVVDAARAAGAHPEGSLVQPLADAGFELIAGVRRDPELGAVAVVAPGGLAAELGGDVALRLLPLRRGEADAMLRELRVFPLLEGRRGPAHDVEAAAGAIEALAALGLALGHRLEALEVNPLIVHRAGHGVTAVDALILTRDEEER
jgi:acetate---CoA ligase (ADP-forming)